MREENLLSFYGIYSVDCPFSDVSSPQLQPILKAAELAKETK